MGRGAIPAIGGRLAAICRCAQQGAQCRASPWTRHILCRWCCRACCLWHGHQLTAVSGIPGPARHPRCATGPRLWGRSTHRRGACWREGFARRLGDVSHCGDAGCVLKARQQLGGTLRVHHTRALSSRSSWRIGFRAEAWRRRRCRGCNPTACSWTGRSSWHQPQRLQHVCHLWRRCTGVLACGRSVCITSTAATAVTLQAVCVAAIACRLAVCLGF